MVLQRYITREISRAVLFTLLAFLSLFAFLELMPQLDKVGYNGYRFEHALLYVSLNLPAYAYELMPIAVLIGSIYALAQFAARSEFTIMRASSLSPMMAAKMLARVGLVFCVLTFIMGEVISPKATEYGEKIRLTAQGTSLSKHFRSGMWAKDVIRSEGAAGEVVGTRFLNIGNMLPDGRLEHLTIYELDGDFHLAAIVRAAYADYTGDNHWQLGNVDITRFPVSSSGKERAITEPVVAQKRDQQDMVSEVTPDILNVLFADPDRMSAYDLHKYIGHLELNNQRTERYEIALWKKVIYPFSVFVMVALALPFAYLHVRAGGVSLKIFAGIMIGVCFQLFSMLFSHLGLINNWTPLVAAGLPNLLFLLLAILALRWAERH